MIHKAIQLRDLNQFTCVVCHTTQPTYTSTDKGILPLYLLAQTNIDYSGGVLADKVIGKAAALLAIELGLIQVDTFIISTEALALLRMHNIPCTYQKEVPYIANRTNTGQCPMEHALDHITDSKQGFHIIDTFIKNREKRGVTS